MASVLADVATTRTRGPSADEGPNGWRVSSHCGARIEAVPSPGRLSSGPLGGPGDTNGNLYRWEMSPARGSSCSRSLPLLFMPLVLFPWQLRLAMGFFQRHPSSKRTSRSWQRRLRSDAVEVSSSTRLLEGRRVARVLGARQGLHLRLERKASSAWKVGTYQRLERGACASPFALVGRFYGEWAG